MKLIINADDLGISPHVNVAIEDAIKKNKISSSTILANTNYPEDVKKIVQLYPKISYGAHLNISEGASLNPCDRFIEVGLIDSKHNFIMENCRKLEYENIDKDLLSCIKKEWDLQLTRLFDYNIKISHIDGHQYCQTWYGLTDILIELANKYHIKKIRKRVDLINCSNKQKVIRKFSCMAYDIGLDFHRMSSLMPNLFKCMIPYQEGYSYQKKLITNGLVTTDYFFSFIEYISNQKRWIDNCTIELMTHPGHIKCEKETEALMNYKLGNNEELISFEEL